MTQTRVITVYGRLPDAADEVGGRLRHGENPASAVVRLFREEAGLPVAVSAVREVRALITPDLHEDRVIFDVVRADAAARSAGALSGGAVVGSAGAASGSPVVGSSGAAAGDSVAGSSGVAAAVVAEPDMPKGQRFAAYGVVSDPAGRILLTRIAPGFPGAGRWHLPGGGTDVGEQPADAMLRELFEETGQRGEIVELLGVTHRRSLGLVGPEGYPMNWHAVRALYRVLVPEPSIPSVTEAAGGSTAAAAWFEPGDLAGLQLTEVVQWAASLPATAE
jgi:8-oxo-dGTP diphosphatase